VFQSLAFGMTLLMAASSSAQILDRPCRVSSLTFPAPQEPAPARPPRPLTTREVQQQIERGLKSEPALAGASLEVAVNATAVVLSGGVYTEQQRDLALRIAESYAGSRRIIDRIEIRQRT
jgi:hypothetical protein